jgi:predicted small integral membrane protein
MVVTTFILIKLMVIGGLTLWMTLAVINNLVGFQGGVAAVGNLMSMHLLRQPPTAESPLLSRAVESARWHRAVFVLTVVLEIGCALLLWRATVLLAGTMCSRTDPAAALVAVNLALAAFLVLMFFFNIGGTWFAYYVRQESLQISHVALIGVAIAAAILCNLQTT